MPDQRYYARQISEQKPVNSTFEIHANCRLAAHAAKSAT
jgi:hypothetical protein